MGSPSPTSRTLQALKADPDCLRAERVEEWVQLGDAFSDLVSAIRQLIDAAGTAPGREILAAIARVMEHAVHSRRGFRRDLFGFIDVVALTTAGIVGIQATTGSNAAARIAKIHDGTTGAFEWVSCHGLIEVWAWRKVAVGKRWLWRPRVVPLTLADLRAGRGAERLHDPPPERSTDGKAHAAGPKDFS